jgi:molybdenum cofactor cytidylyltransferase
VIAGIILAAGRSSRLGRPKQLLPLHGEPLLRHTIRRALESSLDEVTVVIGHHAEEVRAAIADLPVRVAINPAAAKGQSTSVLAGLTSLSQPPSHSAEIEAVVILLGDQPGVEPALIDALIACWRETAAAVVAPRYRDGPGNPVLFDRRVLPELTTLTGDIGARDIIRAHRRSGDLVILPVDHPAPPDVDTEEDYAALIAAFSS